MPTPTPEDIDLARRGAQAALERLRLTRRPGDGGTSAGRLAAVETLWWVCLLAEQLADPGARLTGDNAERDEADLIPFVLVQPGTPGPGGSYAGEHRPRQDVHSPAGDTVTRTPGNALRLPLCEISENVSGHPLRRVFTCIGRG